MIKKNDPSQLEVFLENLMYSDYEDNNMSLTSDDTVIKVVNDFQLILEYLLNKQQSYLSDSKVLENQYNTLVNKAMLDEHQLNENKLKIKGLKNEIKLKENTIYSYKHILDEQKSKRRKFSCQFCEGKVFESEEALLGHFERRHKKNRTLIGGRLDTDQSGYEENASNNQVNTLNQKFLDLTNNFENYMKTFKNEDINKLLENQKTLEAKLLEKEKERHQTETKSLEENFTKVLLELKDLSSVNKNNDKNKDLSEQQTKVNELQNEMLVKQAAVMNSMLAEINKANEEKMMMFQKQVESMKNQLSEELGELKNHSMNLINHSMAEESSRRHKNNLSITSNKIDVEILKQDKADVNNSLVQEAVINNSIINKKIRYNAGILEDDFSGDEHDLNDVNLSVIESKRNQSNILKIKEEIEISFAANCDKEKEELIENHKKLKENVDDLNQKGKRKDEHIGNLVNLVNEMVSDLQSFGVNTNTNDVDNEYKSIFDEIEAKSNLNRSKINNSRKNNKDMSQIKELFDKFVDRDELFVNEKLSIENYKELM